MPAKSSKPDLDTALAELEALVTTMESGDLSLDEAMKQFERGVELTKLCQDALKQAEQKVDILIKRTTDADAVEDFDSSD